MPLGVKPVRRRVAGDTLNARPALPVSG
jgi:hypothetical protein